MPTLEPLSQWICDGCNDTVSKEDGWLEWLDDAQGTRQFHIVHNRARCHHHANHDGCSDMHIDAFLGPDGLQNLLSMLDIGPLLAPNGPQEHGVADVRGYVDTIRRLHVPYYEEARRYFDSARSDGYFADHNEVSIFRPRTCLAIIERYGHA
jgi:hypothetical protein